MNIQNPTRVTAFVALIAAVPCFAEQLEIADGVLALANEQVIYSADENGKLVAYSTSEGKVIWQSQEKAWPLAIRGELLYALGSTDGAHQAVIVAIQRADGRKLKSSVVTFPNDVKPDWRASPARRFTVQWRETDQDPVLYWQYQSQPVRGADVELDLADASDSKDSAGGYRLQIDNGSVQASALSRAQLNARPIESPDLLANEQIADLPRPQFKSATAETVMTSQSEPDSTFGTLYQWRVLQRADQALLGTVRLPYSYAPHWVNGQQLITRLEPYGYLDQRQQPVQHGRRVVSFDLKTGLERWSFLVYDTRFKGLLPP